MSWQQNPGKIKSKMALWLIIQRRLSSFCNWIVAGKEGLCSLFVTPILNQLTDLTWPLMPCEK
jgi:hypothetical protein